MAPFSPIRPDFGILDFEESVIGYRQYDVGGLGLFVQYYYGENSARRFQEAYSAGSGHRFSTDLLDEWEDFTKLRDSIAGIYLNNISSKHGLAFEKGLFEEDNEANAEIGDVLTRRMKTIEDNHA